MTPENNEAAGPDPSWKDLYRAGSVSILLFILLGEVVPFWLLISADYDATMNGKALLEYIAEHRTWWILLQTLVLGSCAFAIVPFMALYPALRHVNKSHAAIGVVLAISCQVLFLAYFPVVNGLFYLSDQYVAATDPAQRQALIGGAEALVAQNNVYGTSEAVFAVSILILSLVMLKSTFHRAVAYLGIVTAASALVGAALKPILGIAYLWWWLLFTAWFIAIGFKLYKLGWSRSQESG